MGADLAARELNGDFDNDLIRGGSSRGLKGSAVLMMRVASSRQRSRLDRTASSSLSAAAAGSARDFWRGGGKDCGRSVL